MSKQEPRQAAWSQVLGAAGIAALSAAAVVRLTNSGLMFVPRHLAWVATVLLIVFTAVEALSIGWNLLVGDPWNQRNVIDRIANFLTYLWP